MVFIEEIHIWQPLAESIRACRFRQSFLRATPHNGTRRFGKRSAEARSSHLSGVALEYWQKCRDYGNQNGGQQIRNPDFLSPDQIDTHAENQNISHHGQVPQRRFCHERPYNPRQSGNVTLKHPLRELRRKPLHGPWNSS